MKNVDIIVQYEECLVWRLRYSKHKLSKGERYALQMVLDNVSYSCGTQLQDLELSSNLADVYVKDVHCHENYTILLESTKISAFIG